ncbi:MAG: tail fiber domain-containing protein [Akkermansiaceae bacterium]
MKVSSLALLLLVSSAAVSLAQTSQVPNLLSYQASVTNAAGTPIGASAPVNRTVTFQFYTTSTGGTPVYAESQVVTIANGDFSVLLGNGNGVSGLPGRVVPASPIRSLASITLSPLYLGITVDDGTAAVDAEISPRQELASAAFATRAQVAEGLADGKLATGMVADSAITTVKIGGNQVTTAKIADANITTAKLATGSVTLDKLDTTAIGVWTPNGPNIYRTSGNVGIGQPSPSHPLNFANALGNKISLYGNSANHMGLGIQPNLLQIYTSQVAEDVAFGYGSSTAFTETMRIKGNGNLGIGTNSPASKLHISGGSAIIDSDGSTSVAVLRGGGVGGAELAVAGGAGAYSTSAATNDAVVRSLSGKLHLQSGNGAAAITVDAANKVGMGTISPVNKLDIRGKLSVGDAQPDAGYNGALQITRGPSATQHINMVRTGNAAWSLGYVANTNTFGIGGGVTTDSDFNPTFRMDTNGRTMINTTNSSQGDLSVGTGGLVSVGSYAGSPGYMRMRYSNDGRIMFDAFNTALGPQEWRGFSYNGNNDLDWQSDRRLKKNIVDAEPMLDRLMQLPFRRYQWKSSINPSISSEFGVIAQEVKPLFPDLIGKGEDGYMTVGYTSFATIACKTIQELKIEKDREIDELRGDLDRKDAELADLSARLLALEKLVSGSR